MFSRDTAGDVYEDGLSGPCSGGEQKQGHDASGELLGDF